MAALHGVTPAAAYRAVVGITWGHVPFDDSPAQADAGLEREGASDISLAATQ
jgi:hypothetical protein